MCPANAVENMTKVCRAGSGDTCDPDEKCTGAVGQKCPADTVMASTTVCRTGSGDTCDPDEKCSGTAGQMCPTDVVKDSMFVCRASTGPCDTEEQCTGIATNSCPADAPLLAGSVTTTGLVIHVDAANTTSYPGTGQQWFDLTGNGHHFDLGATSAADAADPTFSAGSFEFDGNDFFTKSETNGAYVNSIHKAGATLTVEIWQYVPAVLNNFHIMLGTTNNVGVNGFRWIPESPWDFSVYNNGQLVFEGGVADGFLQRGTWQQSAIAIHVPNQNALMVRNGATYSSYTVTYTKPATTDAPNRLRLGTQTNDGAGIVSNGTKYAIVRMYDRALTVGDLASNYCAQRSRFGL
jgi:hypothetical protein